jgi:transcriptional regulator with XRE-family HTH domain
MRDEIIYLVDNKLKAKQFRLQFGKAVRRRRLRLGLSQENFAENAEIHRTYVSSIELAKVEIGIGVAYKLAKALKTSLSKLIRNAENAL